MRRIEFCFLFVLIASMFSCAKAAPTSSPSLASTRPARAWLTLEEDGKFVGYAEIAEELSQGILKEEHVPEAPGFKEFSPAFLAETSVSADGVTVVRALGEPFVKSFRKLLNRTLRSEGYSGLSASEFEEALRCGQLTCHFGSVMVSFDRKGTMILGDYACIAGLECGDNLLFSVTSPENQDEITASITLYGVISRGKVTMACVTEEDRKERVENAVPARDPADSDPWLVTWEELFPILQGVVSLEETDVKRRGVAACNISPEGVNMGLVVVASRALNQYALQVGGEGGMDAFLDLVAGNGQSFPLWEDPCLPKAIAPFLRDQGITLVGDEELTEQCVEWKRSSQSSAPPGRE